MLREAVALWIRNNWALTVFGLLFFCGSFYGGFQLIFRNSDAYDLTLSAISRIDEVASRIGEPISVGWSISGSFSTNASVSTVRLEFAISGPKGEGQVFSQSEQIDGEWIVRCVTMDFGSGPEIQYCPPSL